MQGEVQLPLQPGHHQHRGLALQQGPVDRMVIRHQQGRIRMGEQACQPGGQPAVGIRVAEGVQQAGEGGGIAVPGGTDHRAAPVQARASKAA